MFVLAAAVNRADYRTSREGGFSGQGTFSITGPTEGRRRGHRDLDRADQPPAEATPARRSRNSGAVGSLLIEFLRCASRLQVRPSAFNSTDVAIDRIASPML